MAREPPCAPAARVHRRGDDDVHRDVRVAPPGALLRRAILIWANIIGLILIYLSVGYFVGGRLADRHPTMRFLCWLMLAAAACVAVLPFVAEPFLSAAVDAFAGASVGAFLGSFFAVMLLFSAPITLLGMASPFAVRLGVTTIEEAGAVAGRMYALSTSGSILGTFLPVAVLIPPSGRDARCSRPPASWPSPHRRCSAAATWPCRADRCGRARPSRRREARLAHHLRGRVGLPVRPGPVTPGRRPRAASQRGLGRSFAVSPWSGADGRLLGPVPARPDPARSGVSEPQHDRLRRRDGRTGVRHLLAVGQRARHRARSAGHRGRAPDFGLADNRRVRVATADGRVYLEQHHTATTPSSSTHSASRTSRST